MSRLLNGADLMLPGVIVDDSKATKVYKLIFLSLKSNRICVCITKYLANHRTYMVLLYYVASQVLGRFITILGEGITHHPP